MDNITTDSSFENMKIVVGSTDPLGMRYRGCTFCHCRIVIDAELVDEFARDNQCIDCTIVPPK